MKERERGRWFEQLLKSFVPLIGGGMEKEKFVLLPAISFDKLCVNRFILPSQDENYD